MTAVVKSRPDHIILHLYIWDHVVVYIPINLLVTLVVLDYPVLLHQSASGHEKDSFNLGDDLGVHKMEVIHCLPKFRNADEQKCFLIH
jgi:hypothetical protein